MEQRINFFQIFKINPNGSISPIRPVRIGSIQLSPGVSFGAGVSFGPVNLFNFIGRDFQAEESNGILIIKGIYSNE